MALESPLHPLHQQAEATFLRYGADDRRPQHGTAIGEHREAVGGIASALVVETFGEVEGEYAALRKGCVLIDLPQRGALRITGRDRIDFLGRMVTQELKGLASFQARSAFWLSRKGRIDADLRLVELADETWADVDALVAAGATHSLRSFVFSEDVRIEDLGERMHRLALHGPTGLAVLNRVARPAAGPVVSALAPGDAAAVQIAGRRVIVDRNDTTGDIGLELLMDAAEAHDVYQALLEAGIDDGGAGAHQSGQRGAIRLRTAGWAAYNIARIEAGTPLFNVDFGPGNLPHETGILERRVSFTKGCYLGQEVVARMQSLGHPKQRLVALRVDEPKGAAKGGIEGQPITGSVVIKPESTDGGPVGAVTSSTRSPMLGDAIACFAQVKWESTPPGTRLLVQTEAGPAPAVVQPTLAFWSRPAT